MSLRGILGVQGIKGLVRPIGIAVLASLLGACASLGDEPFALGEADTGAQMAAPAVATVETATAPADLGGGAEATVLTRYPNAVLAVAEEDPYEDFNRSVFYLNDTLDTYIAVPIAETYRALLPELVRDGVRNAFTNLGSPVTWANDVLQGDWDRASVTFSRFAINSTLGIGGLHDVAASEFNLQPHFEDFDQTMALAGVASGPYLVMPLLGPTTPRHMFGRLVDSFAHPLTWILPGESLLVLAAPRAVELASTRADFIEPVNLMKASTPDYYAAVRSLYRQIRTSEIGNGQAGPGEVTSLDEDLDLSYE